jgi:hypothetical protein
MNLYNLLRLLVKGAAQTGGMTKEQTYDALELIDNLEKLNAFGHIQLTTTGYHKYLPKQKYIGPYQVIEICGVCDKSREGHHE